MVQQSSVRRVQARLGVSNTADARHEPEKQALKIYDYYLAHGETARRTLTEALICLGEKYNGEALVERSTIQGVSAKLSRIEKTIAENQKALESLILNALSNLDLSSYRNEATGRTMQDEVGGLIPQSFLTGLKQASGGMSFDDDD